MKHTIRIDEAVCRGCHLCRKACPRAAIKIYEGFAHIEGECIGCGLCFTACPFHAIKETKPCESKGREL
ncbi:4Fe-4S binding protein [Intestinimonas butyriciproducens]|uniref:indolepyruvate ferredoxin oxidoreductase subunit alpha n=1 Tax=Intestinimonas butyriciproducens TaxID=1297617 RepID=UPI0009E91666